MLWVIGLVVVGAGLFGLGWVSHGTSGNPKVSSPSAANSAVSSAKPGSPATTQPQAAPRALLSRSEFEQFRAARDSALQANPDLAAEYKQILADMQAQQAKLDAAMVKADPKAAPIVAKLVALRQINGAHAPSAVASPR